MSLQETVSQLVTLITQAFKSINKNLSDLNDKKADKTDLEEVFQSVSNGKELIASAITDMGIDTSKDDTFQTMADNITSIINNGSDSDISDLISIINNKFDFGITANMTLEEIKKIVDGYVLLSLRKTINVKHRLNISNSEDLFKENIKIICNDSIETFTIGIKHTLTITDAENNIGLKYL